MIRIGWTSLCVKYKESIRLWECFLIAHTVGHDIRTMNTGGDIVTHGSFEMNKA